MFGLIPFSREVYSPSQNLFHYLDNIEKSFFGDTEAPVSQFRTDVRDKENEFLLEAELPGFKKEDIKIDLNGDRLTITAVRQETEEDKKENFIYRERKYGSFSRSFDTSGIDTGAITAGYENGLLTLHLPKKQAQQPDARRIELN